MKQLYRERLEEIPYVKKGYIKINGKDADVIIVISEYSVDRIKRLAKIDLEINLKFRPLYFHVEYKRSEKDLELEDFDRFYKTPTIFNTVQGVPSLSPVFSIVL